MSVPVGKRGLSDMEFYHSAIRLRVWFTEWLLRDFGIKDKVRSLNIIESAVKMQEEDRQDLEAVLNKYGFMSSLVNAYPDWWICTRRQIIDETMASMVRYIRIANSIYPTSEAEFFERRLNQDRAIGMCYALLEELQYTIEVLNKTIGIDLNKYEPFILGVDNEIKLLKGWRKSDNKILQRIRKGKPV